MATDNHRDTAMLFPDLEEFPQLPPPQPVAPSAGQPGPADESDNAADGGPEAFDDGPAPLQDESAPLMPGWVAAHIPADPLVYTPPPHRFRRRQALPSLPPAEETPPDLPPAPVVTERPRRRNVGLALGGVLAVAALVTGIGVMSVTDDPAPTAPAALATTPAQASAPRTGSVSSVVSPVAAPPWCVTATTPDSTTANGAGDVASPVGIITAFEHAYYVQRSGEAVAALMRSPAPPERIQGVIDATPVGTQHCVTIVPAEAPDVHAVALALRTPSGAESLIRSRITTVPVDGGYRISAVEEVR